MTRLTSVVAILVVLESCADAIVHTKEFPHSAVLMDRDRFTLFWEHDDSTVTMEIHVQVASGWIGLGISHNGGMTGSDVIMGWMADGKTVFSDRYAAGEYLPEVDDSQDWELQGMSLQDGYTVLTARRPIKTCDKQDVTISDTTVRIIYAYGPLDASGKPTKHTVRGSRSIQIINPNSGARPALPASTITWELLNPNTTVPPTDTTYWCHIFKLPKLSTKHHVIKVEPVIQLGNEAFVHHILVYACWLPVNASYAGTGHECFGKNMPDDFRHCRIVIFAWAVGGGPQYWEDHVGYPFGHEGSPDFVVMETHWDNPNLRSDFVDGSGIRVYLTPELRQYDAGILETGLIPWKLHVIPPKFPDLSSYGFCPQECLKQGMVRAEVSEIKVMGAILHSHLLGVSITLRHIRDGKELPPILSDPSYDFNFQEYYPTRQEVTVKAGDELLVECVYNSEKREQATVGGISTREEMCLAFLVYYPAIPLTVCNTAPTPRQTLSFTGSEGAYTGSQRYVLQDGEYKGMDMYQVVETVDWGQTSSRDAFQRAIRGGEVIPVCQGATKEAFKVPEVMAIPNVTSWYKAPDTCTERKEGPVGGATVGTVSLFLLTAALLQTSF